MKIRARVLAKDDKEIAPGALRMSSQTVPVTVGFDGTKVVGSATVYADGTAELEIDAPIERVEGADPESGVLGLGFVVEKERYEGSTRIIEKIRPVTVGISGGASERHSAREEAVSEEARAVREEAPEPLRPFAPRDRVALWEKRGVLEITNLGTVVKRSRSGYVHVEWDDRTEGWFSPAKAASMLKFATGDDALPRHVWIFDVPESEAPGWKESGAPLPTLDEPVCAICREVQTDENEYGPCFKVKP